ncbi:MAG: alpha-amylase [Chloroflexi bacterium]|nr:alpha-amylase [Chloroflexota bacterium]
MNRDFIFGTLHTEAQRLAFERDAREGIHHDPYLSPPDPRPHQEVTLTVTLGPQVPADRVTVYYTTEDMVPRGHRGRPQVGEAVPLTRVSVEWDTLLWGYRTVWQGRLPGQPEGTVVRYTVEAWHSATRFSRFLQDGDRLRVFGYGVDEEPVAEWLRAAVIYQIMPDRFAPDPGTDFDRSADPQHDIMGGTLRGITSRLDYLARLGITALWLTPIFPSPTYHRYDATDYGAVDPRLGTLEDMDALVAEAHRRGIRVILDFVANHCSDRHPAFVAAQQDPHAATAKWFTFEEWPHRYRTFFGVRSMPQFNVDDPGARAYLIDHAVFWLKRGVDGFRLDYANGPSHLFWSEFRRATRSARQDSALFGEVVHTPALMRSYVGRMDGVLDFVLLQHLRAFLAYHTLPPSAFDVFLRRHVAYFPPDLVLPAFFDNHDMNRFLWIVGNDTRRLRLAALFLFTMPGPPILYYGTEVGLSQDADVVQPNGWHHHGHARLPMPWGEDQDRDLYAFFQRIIRVRRAGGAVWWTTPITPRVVDDARGVYAYARGPYVVVLNTRDHGVDIPLDVGSLLLTTDDRADVRRGHIHLPPYGGIIAVE